MQVVVWIVIILLALLLIWLLRKWIKRLIFILILLVLAFFIYGIFNSSGASRLWYNVRTFPQRVTSWISDKKEFLDYDSYKLNLSDV
jgi:predicted PurR-regulated permease PerM